MGLNFRKRIKIAPGVSLNIGKKSVGISAGVKGARVSVNSSGRKTATVGVPGTGVYYTKSSNVSKHTNNTKNTVTASSGSAGNPKNKNGKDKWYTRTGWIIALLLLFFPVGIFLMWKYKKNWNTGLKGVITAAILGIAILSSGGDDSPEPPAVPVQSETIQNEKEEAKLQDKQKVEEETRLKAEEAKQQAEEEARLKAEEEARLKAEEEAKQQAEEEARLKAEEEAKQQVEEEAKLQAAENAQRNDDPIVYITDTGKKYHRSGCRHLKKSKIETHLSDVIGIYEPCGVCNPPTR